MKLGVKVDSFLLDFDKEADGRFKQAHGGGKEVITKKLEVKKLSVYFDIYEENEIIRWGDGETLF